MTEETPGSDIYGAVDEGICLSNYPRPQYGGHMVAAIVPVLEAYYRDRTEACHHSPLLPIDHLRYGGPLYERGD